MSKYFRADWHDYSGPGYYHLTFMKNPAVEDFSIIKGNALIPSGQAGSAYVKYYSGGYAIAAALRELPSIHPSLKLLRYAIMPDHLHLLLQVSRQMDEKLGYKMARFKALVNKRLKGNETDQAGIVSAFEKSFHDRVLFNYQELNIVRDYIIDNPRKWLYRQQFPNYFTRVNDIMIGGYHYKAYGNLQLLCNPYMQEVIIHSYDDEEIRNKKRWICDRISKNGGILISPFISPEEKKIRVNAEENRGRIILLCEREYGPRQKPSNHDFYLCAEGRMLVLTPIDDNFKRLERMRDRCLYMNKRAEEIVHLAKEGRLMYGYLR